jgi:hypothetical protein
MMKLACSLVKLEPTTEVLRAYLYQLVWQEFNFSDDFIQKIIKLKPVFQTKTKSSWDLMELNHKDIQTLFSDNFFIPEHFYCFKTSEKTLNDSFDEQKAKLISKDTDYKEYPELFTDIHQVSIDNGGLISMQLFNYQVYKLFKPNGEELIPHCHDLDLGVGGLVLCRSSENNGGIWELFQYDGVQLGNEEKERQFFSPFDSPPDFPHLEDRDRCTLILEENKGLADIYLEMETLSRNEFFELLEENEHNYRYLSAYYANDVELAEKAVIKNKLAFTLLNSELQHDENFVRRLLKNKHINKHVYNYLPHKFKHNEEFVFYCIEDNPRIIKNLSPIQNKNLLIKAITSGNSGAFEYASDQLRSDLDCIKIAMRKEWYVIRYIPKQIILNTQFLDSIIDWYNQEIELNRSTDRQPESLSKLKVIEYLCPSNPLIIGQLSPVDNLELIKLAVRYVTTADFAKFLQLCTTNLKENPAFWLSLLKVNSNVMNFIPSTFLQNHYFLLEAIEAHGEVFTLVPEEYRNEEALAFSAIQQIVNRRGYCSPQDVIPYIGQELMNDKHFIKRVLLVWPHILDFVHDSLKNNEELFLYAIKNSYPWVISKASDELRNKVDFVLAALKINEKVFNSLNPNMKSNKTVQATIDTVTLQNYLISLNTTNRSESIEEDDDELPF